MEPLTPLFQTRFRFSLRLFYFLLVPLPIGISLIRLIPGFDPSLLTPVFFEVLLKTILFSLGQASLSVFIIALFVYCLSAYFFSRPPTRNNLFYFEAISFLSFSLSPTLVSLCLIFVFFDLFGHVLNGLYAILLCHFLLNAAYFSSQFLNRSVKQISGSKSHQLSYLKSLGASRSNMRSLLLIPLFIQDLKSWAPQVFIWCFYSFTPVLLLSDKAQQKSPDLLLYYSLLNDPTGTRLLIIFLVTAAVSLCLNFFIKQKNTVLDPAEDNQSTPTKTTLLQKYLLLLVGLFFLFPFAYSALSPVSNQFIFSEELTSILGPTLIIFVLSFVFSFLFCSLSALCGREIKTISQFRFLSPPMLLLGLFFFVQLTPRAPLVWISLGTFLSIAPWLHHKIHARILSLPQETTHYCLSLGISNFKYFRIYLWPAIKPICFRLSLLVSLWSLGEYTFSNAFLDTNSTLALFIEEKIRRYNFAEASTALSLSLLLSFIVVLTLLWKGKKNATL